MDQIPSWPQPVLFEKAFEQTKEWLEDLCDGNLSTIEIVRLRLIVKEQVEIYNKYASLIRQGHIKTREFYSIDMECVCAWLEELYGVSVWDLSDKNHIFLDNKKVEDFKWVRDQAHLL